MEMKRAVSAGGVVIKSEKGIKKILLIAFEDGSGLGFPKGTVEKGEKLENAALREVTEETSLKNLEIIKKLGIVTRPSTQNDGTVVDKDIHLYLMETNDYNHSIKTDENYGWYTFDEGIAQMGFREEAQFLKQIVAKLQGPTS